MNGSTWRALTGLEVGGVPVWRAAGFALVLLVSLAAGRIVRFLMERAAVRAATEKERAAAPWLRALARPASLLSFVLGFNLGLALLSLTGGAASLADTVSDVLYAVGLGYTLYRLVDVLNHYLSRAVSRTQSRVDDMLAPLVGRSVRITIVVVVVLQIAQALSDKPVMSIVASLGVGGIAVALAAQDTIKNFFGSLVILADKPFEIGERVVIGGHDGPVENVGFRSTKIRTLEGHLITVPNAEIANSTVQNIGRRPYIRRVANLTITYDTPPEKVEEALAIVKDVLKDHEGMNPELPPRVFFNEFNDCSLNIMAIYWYHPPDYWAFQAFTERVNREILRRFNGAGIEFAFPTQTLYLAGDPNRRLTVQGSS